MDNSDEIRKQWHGPFCSAMRLELRENSEDVTFENERTLSSRPLQIDLLIIKKTADVKIDNEIGKIFRGHNLLEYKSPGDELSVREYFKVLGYACLYRAIGRETSPDPKAEIREDDITVSFVREGYPRELVRYLRECGYRVKKKRPGIYYVMGAIFPIQIIVSGKLDPELHFWLKSLTRDMDRAQAENLILKISSLPPEGADRENADSVLNLAMQANPELFGRVKEENPMCEAFFKLFKPEIDATVKTAVDAAVKTAVDDNTDAVKTQGVDSIIQKVWRISGRRLPDNRHQPRKNTRR